MLSVVCEKEDSRDVLEDPQLFRDVTFQMLKDCRVTAIRCFCSLLLLLLRHGWQYKLLAVVIRVPTSTSTGAKALVVRFLFSFVEKLPAAGFERFTYSMQDFNCI